MQNRLYSVWHNMKSRCYNPKASHYAQYGGRGITVCPEWRDSFEAFRDWALANGYRDDLTIDRKDNDGPYSPENCRWADMYCQNNNTRKNNYITYKGETKTASEWAREYGLHRCVLNNRIRRGWDIEEALTKPPDKSQRREATETQPKKAPYNPPQKCPPTRIASRRTTTHKTKDKCATERLSNIQEITKGGKSC